MGKRIFSTVLLWVIVGAALWLFRTNGALVLITIISVFTLREFYQLMHASGYDPFDKIGLVFGGVITLTPWLHAHCPNWPMHLLLPLAVIVFAVRLLGERTPECTHPCSGCSACQSSSNKPGESTYRTSMGDISLTQ